MPTKTLPITVDTYTDQDHAATKYGTATKLLVNGEASHKIYAYFWVKLPFNPGATVIAASLKIRLAAAWSAGPHTITVSRVLTKWAESTATWTNLSAAGTEVSATNTATASVTGGTANQEVTIDVHSMVGDAAAGSTYFGFRLEIDTTGDKKIWSGEAVNSYHPKLVVQWANIPAAPESLVPQDGAIIDPANPILSWNKIVDPDGAATQAYSELLISENSDMSTPVYDSTLFANTVSAWDLSTQDVQVITLTAFSGTDSFKLTYNAVESAAFVRLTNATATAIQAAMRTLTKDTGLIVTGTTDAGPFTFTFSKNAVPEQQTITLTGFGGTDSFKLTYNGAESATSIVRGTNAAASDVQTLLRTLTGDTGLTVTGATDAGPYVVLFTASFGDARALTVTSPSGCTGVVAETDKGTGAAHDISVTSPVGCTGAMTRSRKGGFALYTGVTYYWKVKVKDSNGNTSAYSDPVSMSRTAASSVVITSPGATADEQNPPITWTFGGTQTGYRIVVVDNVTGLDLWDSGRVASTDQTVALPDAYPLTRITAAAYTVTVYVWDSLARVDLPGSPASSSDTQDTTFDSVSGAAHVLTLVASQTYADVTLTWTRAAAPNYFALTVDGLTPTGVDSNGNAWQRLDPADYLVSGTTYALTWLRATPGESHTYAIHAVVNNAGVLEVTTGDPTAALTTDPPGLWLVEETQNIQLVVTSLDSRISHEWSIGEEATDYYPIGRQDPVRIVTSSRGYEGTISGHFMDYGGMTFVTLRENLEAIKDLGTDARVRLIVGSLNFPVRIGSCKLAPMHPTGYNVSIDFTQIDEFAIVPDGIS